MDVICWTMPDIKMMCVREGCMCGPDAIIVYPRRAKTIIAQLIVSHPYSECHYELNFNTQAIIVIVNCWR